MTHRSLLIACLLLAACSSDEGSSTPTPDPVEPPGCERTDALEADFATGTAAGPTPLGFWMGPGADPATGALAEPDAAGYVVATTRLNLRAGSDELFGQHIGAISAQLAQQPGFVALQVGSSPRCGVARTLSVWRDEESLYGFVASGAHKAAIDDTARLSRGLSNTTHFAAARAAEASWSSAARAIARDDGPFY